MRENPDDEKSCHESVARLAARACRCQAYTCQCFVEHENGMERTARAPSVKSNCNFLSSAALPKPIASNSPHLRSVKLLKRSSPSLSSNNVEPTDDAEETEEVRDGGVRVEVVNAAPVSGWKFGGRSIRFLYASEYRGGSLSVGGAMRSHSFDPANARSD